LEISRKTKAKIKNTLIPYLLILPAILFVGGILGYAVFSGIFTSLFRVSALYIEEPFVGLQNYIDLFTDPVFQNALIRSLIFVLGSVVLGILISMTFALSLYKITKLRNVFKGLTLIPYLVSGIAAAIMWRFMFIGDGGFVNLFIESLGFDTFTWLAHPARAMFVVILANVWFISPFAILILLAGLQSLDPNLIEAARVDGANKITIFFKIILPLIAPMVGISLIWLSFATFNMFDIILPLTGGGPGRATEVLAVFMYDLAFEQLNYSLASAVMVVLMSLNMLVSIIYLKLFEV